jgi:hypothetical protein
MTTAPIPNHVEGIWCTPEGSIVRFRAVGISDAELVREFVRSLSLLTASTMVTYVEPRRFQNAKHEQPSAPQKLLRSSTGVVPPQARPWSWPWTPQVLAQPHASASC